MNIPVGSVWLNLEFGGVDPIVVCALDIKGSRIKWFFLDDPDNTTWDDRDDFLEYSEYIGSIYATN